jgi:hypothetical protein
MPIGQKFSGRDVIRWVAGEMVIDVFGLGGA